MTGNYIDYDVVVIGGGIVGLASAYKILKKYPSLKLAVLEKEKSLGLHQTSHNSGVIHSGLYYKKDSKKALLCVKGRLQLIEFAKKNNIKFEICGKIVVATNKAELLQLEKLWSRGLGNGLSGMLRLNAEEIQLREPCIRGEQAILVPEEGIINYADVAESLREEILTLGGAIKTKHEVVRIVCTSNYEKIILKNGQVLCSSFVVSCAGLQSDRIAKKSGLNPQMKIVPFKGEYYKFKKDFRYLVNHLVYPVPDPSFPFLGVHFTRMIDGEVECGPNAVLSYDREGYSPWSFNLKDALESIGYIGFLRLAMKYWRKGLGEIHRSLSKAAFVKALQKMLPHITEDHVEFAGCGIRAQAISDSGEMIDDFVVLGKGRQIHVLNAPSPAATASFAIGDYLLLEIEKIPEFDQLVSLKHSLTGFRLNE